MPQFGLKLKMTRIFMSEVFSTPNGCSTGFTTVQTNLHRTTSYTANTKGTMLRFTFPTIAIPWPSFLAFISWCVAVIGVLLHSLNSSTTVMITSCAPTHCSCSCGCGYGGLPLPPFHTDLRGDFSVYSCFNKDIFYFLCLLQFCWLIGQFLYCKFILWLS